MRTLLVLLMVASPAWAQNVTVPPSLVDYQPELPPLMDPMRVLQVLGFAVLDEPRDESEIIDVLVVWSQTVSFSPALAQQAVDNSNADFSRSLIRARFRLVGAQRISFTESMGSGLNWMIGAAGRAVLLPLRDASGADVVHMVTNDNPAGIGYYLVTESYAYSTSHVSYTIGNRTFQHEIGHNVGLHHDPGQGNAPNCGAVGVAEFNCGHAFTGGRTNMAYNGGPRIGYFSNPDVSYNGSPTGTASRNNARQFNDRAAYVAGFRVSKVHRPSRPVGARVESTL